MLRAVNVRLTAAEDTLVGGRSVGGGGTGSRESCGESAQGGSCGVLDGPGWKQLDWRARSGDCNGDGRGGEGSRRIGGA